MSKNNLVENLPIQERANPVILEKNQGKRDNLCLQTMERVKANPPTLENLEKANPLTQEMFLQPNPVILESLHLPMVMAKTDRGKI